MAESENTRETMDNEEKFLHCTVCDLLFTGIEPYDQHLNGSKHKKKQMEKKWLAKSDLQTSETNALVTSSAAENSNASQSPIPHEDFLPFTIICHVCETVCSGMVPYEQHLKGEKHMKEVKKKEMLKRYRLEKAEEKGEEDPDIARGDENPDHDSEEDLFICEACGKKCSGYIPYQQHMGSHPHAKQVHKKILEEGIKNIKGEESEEETALFQEIDPKEQLLYATLPQLKPYAFCSKCNKKFSGPETYNQHIRSEAHKREVLKKKLSQQLIAEGVLNFSSSSEEGNEFPQLKPFAKCALCNKDFSGPVPYQQHMISDVHKKQLQKEELAEKIKDLLVSEKIAEEDMDEHFVCKECSKAFSGPLPFAQHIISKSHDKQKSKNQILETLLSNECLKSDSELLYGSERQAEGVEDDKGASEMGQMFLKPRVLSCTMCHVAFSGPESAAAHFASRGHLKTQLMKERMSQQKKNSQNTTENVQNTTEKNSQNTTEKNSQNTTEKNTQNTTEKNSQNTTENVQNTTEKNSQNTTEKNSQNTTEKNTQNATEKNSQNTTEKNSQNTTEKDTQNTTEKNSQNTTEKNSQNTTEKNLLSNECLDRSVACCVNHQRNDQKMWKMTSV